MNGLKIKSKRLNRLRPVLKKWISNNERIGWDWSNVGDAPWWHIERALVSMLAGAIWGKGGDAFEEYSEPKRGKHRKSSGRIDLWFTYQREDYKAEAKQCWVRPHREKESLDHICEVMSLAKGDAGSLDGDGMQRLAIVFGAVMIPKNHAERTGELLDAAIILAQDKKIGADAVAWTFPKLDKPLVDAKGRVYPGIIMWLKEVRRSPR